jgi:VWFA-related protein
VRADFVVGELEYAVAKEDFVFAQLGEWESGHVGKSYRKSRPAAVSSELNMMPTRRRLTALLAAGLMLIVVARLQGGAPQQAAAPQPAPSPGGATTPATPQPTPPGQQPTFRTGIDFVRVDVIVTDKGQPVTDLTQADFEVREDGRTQTVEQFRLIKVDGTVRPGDPPPRPIRNRDDEELEAGRDDVRVIVIFLDDYHTRLSSSLSVRQSLIDFIQKQLRPRDMLAVMYPLSPASELSFTRNHDQIISAINAFQGRKFRYEPKNQFEEQYSQQPTETVENLRNQVVMGALRGVSARLGAVREGRKTLIYVSEGLTVLLPPQLRNQNAEMQGNLPNGVGPGAGENSAREDTARAFALGDLTLRLRDVFEAANRNNVAVYSLDPRGLATNEFGIDENVGPQQDAAALRMTQDTLRMLSENTDGKAIVSRNDLARGLQQVVQDSSYYYLIGYTSSAPTDGRFHEVKVDVKRRGVDVRARRGFWAATTDDVERATRVLSLSSGPSKAVENALASIAPAVRASQYVRTWVGTTRGQNGRTHVTVVWEPIVGPPGSRREVPGRVSIIAARESGELVYRGRSAGDSVTIVPAVGPGTNAVRAGAVPVVLPAGPQRLEFDAPPGPMELRLSIEAAVGGVLDSEIRKVTVPDLTGAQTTMSTPRVFRARTARDLQALAQDGAATPLAAREFSRADRVLIRFDSYGAGTELPRATAVLLNRSGQKVLDVPVVQATTGGTHQIDLGLNQVPPGEYLVEITLSGTGTGGEARELVPLRVGS